MTNEIQELLRDCLIFYETGKIAVDLRARLSAALAQPPAQSGEQHQREVAALKAMGPVKERGRGDPPLYPQSEAQGWKKDAERYRWLRLEIAEAAVPGRGALVEIGEWSYDAPEGLDAAIDAAMLAAAAAGEEKE